MVLLHFLLASATALISSVSATPLSPLAVPSRNCGASPEVIANTTTSFILKEYLVETVASTGRVRGTFTIENPAAGGDVYRLYHIPVTTGGGTWSVCQPPIDGDIPLPPQLARCQYLVERYRQTIGFRFQWYCDRPGNTNTPVLFDATVIGDMPTEVCVDKTEGEISQSCAFAADVKEVVLEVANIYYEEVLADGQAIE
ncbi:hypothetical protein QBC37DRAFT_449867 [Rhypophila decipiens]|uniref:Uncharacterized protein n=1 Tax=Rhypophila decipiens TaxID=261697 RepID=A0AAN7B1W1_9PEZI|nr:hypothetical protein QBC37DRAFT_449867 [Rhypophila decipiens]